MLVTVISICRQLHSPTNLILLSLAIGDFLIGLLVMPVEILVTMTCWLLGDLMCALYFLLPLSFLSASVGNMVLISIDRYVAICDPLHYHTRVTLKVTGISVGVCWIISVFYSNFIVYDHLKQPGRYNSCYGECVANVAGDVDLVIAFIIPVSLIVFLYLRVFLVAVSQANAMRSQVGAANIKKSELKAARSLGVIVVVFLFCYCPYYCVSFTGSNILIGSSTEAFIAFLVYFNSCLNPIIYAFLYPWFRKSVKLIITLQILQPDSCETNIM